MIDGVVTEFSSKELVQHCSERQQYHQSQARACEKEIATLDSDRQNQRQQQATQTDGVADPVQSLRRAARANWSQAQYFATLATHLVSDEDYRLNDADLVRLEIVSPWGQVERIAFGQIGQLGQEQVGRLQRALQPA